MVKYSVPHSLRQTFDLFRFYEQSMGIESVLERINWTAVTPSQLYCAGLGRLPENRSFAVPKSDFSPKQFFDVILGSIEFQSNIIENLLRAYPEKQRALFVHI